MTPIATSGKLFSNTPAMMVPTPKKKQFRMPQPIWALRLGLGTCKLLIRNHVSLKNPIVVFRYFWYLFYFVACSVSNIVWAFNADCCYPWFDEAMLECWSIPCFLERFGRILVYPSFLEALRKPNRSVSSHTHTDPKDPELQSCEANNHDSNLKDNLTYLLATAKPTRPLFFTWHLASKKTTCGAFGLHPLYPNNSILLTSTGLVARVRPSSTTPSFYKHTHAK